jgi:hypothetical protein
MEELVALGIQAVQTLYNDPDPQNKKQAEAWLLAVRTSPEAWELGWALLAFPEPHPALHYQGGLILQYKVRMWQ